MRVTTGMAVATLTNNLGRSYERISRYQTELSSGTRLNKLSDDPAGVERSLALRSELRNIEQFQKNIDDGVGWLELSEATLNELAVIFVEARGLAVQGGTSNYNAAQRNAIAEQVDQYLEHALGLSESRNRGRYIFSGTQTGTAPYVANRDVDGNIIDVVPAGDAGGSIEREVVDGIVMQVNVPGGEIFESPKKIRLPINQLAAGLEDEDQTRLYEIVGEDQQSSVDALNAVLDQDQDPPLSPDLREVLTRARDQFNTQLTNPFAVLIELRNALREDNIDDVRSTMDRLDHVAENISSVRGLIGARVNRMETLQNVLDRVSVEMTSILSDDEGVDLSTSIVNLRQEQDVFQAALASGSTVIPQSLMDFI